MNYISTITTNIKSYYRLKSENPEVSLPVDGTEIILTDWYLIHTVPPPDYNRKTQRLETGDPEMVEGSYYEVWLIVELTQQELDAIQARKDRNVQSDMVTQGQQVTVDDDSRASVGSPSAIIDKAAHDAWMQSLYAAMDAHQVNTPKPPPDERQGYELFEEDANPFRFTRFHDEWGYRWRMDLESDDVTNLALYIQDSQGNYLYTTGALLDNGNGGWYTECPAGQADATIEDVYFHWILGAGRISSDFRYAAVNNTLSNIVRSDTDYD